MHTRIYTPADETAVLNLITIANEVDRNRRLSKEAFHNLWNAMHQPDGTISYRESTVITNDSGRLMGFAWWDVTDMTTQTGYILLRYEGWVHPDYRRQGVGTRLLQDVEAYVHQHLSTSTSTPRQVRIVSRTYRDIPGGTALLEQQGYSLGHMFYIMARSLQGQPIPVVPLAAGITLRSFDMSDLEAVVDADNDIFQDHWNSNNRSLAQWKLEMIDNRPHDPKLWVLAVEDEGEHQRVVATCLCHASLDPEVADSWIAMVGVRRTLRGTGLGRAVTAEGMRRLLQAGFTSAGLSVDSENTPAVRLYQSLGFDIVRERMNYAKVITV